MLPGSLESAAMLQDEGWTGLAIDNEEVVNGKVRRMENYP